MAPSKFERRESSKKRVGELRHQPSQHRNLVNWLQLQTNPPNKTRLAIKHETYNGEWSNMLACVQKKATVSTSVVQKLYLRIATCLKQPNCSHVHKFAKDWRIAFWVALKKISPHIESITSALRLPANKAPSLQTLASSAPDIPFEILATIPQASFLVSSDRMGVFLRCTAMILARPASVGNGTTTRLESLPGLVSAESSTCNRSSAYSRWLIVHLACMRPKLKSCWWFDLARKYLKKPLESQVSRHGKSIPCPDGLVIQNLTYKSEI